MGTKLAWFYSKNEWASRKLLCFVNWHNSSYLKLVNFEFSKSIFYVKNCLYYLRNIFLLISLDKTNLFYRGHILLTLNLEILYFLKLRQMCPVSICTWFLKYRVWNVGLINFIFFLVWTLFFQATRALKITFKLDKASSSSSSNFQTGELIVLKLLLYLYFRTKVLKFRHDILIK